MWIITILLVLGTTYYLYLRFKFSYFRRVGLAEDPGYFPLGSKSSWGVLMGKIALPLMTNDVYHNFPNDKLVGTYTVFGKPVIVIRDLELAKRVLIKDFDHFTNRRPVIASEKSNKYFLKMLTILTGDKWKQMRAILTPVFTSGKLKSMLDTIYKISDDLVSCVNSQPGETDVKKLMTSFMCNVISNVGLGIEFNAFQEPDGVVRKNISKLIGENSSFMRMAKLMIIVVFPRLAKALDVAFIDQGATEFFAKVIKSSLEHRKKEPVKRNDFINAMLDALKDQTTGFSNENLEDALISNVLMLFFGGFDTTSTALSVCLHFLAKNQDAQETLLKEIQAAVAENRDQEKLDYYVIQSLPFLDKFIHESLRMYPIALIERVCVKDCKLEGTNYVIPKGMLIQIASPGIMLDEKYFPNPNTFDPEHFSMDQQSEREPFAFFAFGHGPRNCIGKRFGLLVMKVAIAKLVLNFIIKESARTSDKLDPDPLSVSSLPKGGFWLEFNSRE